eukprot:COSAG01_NODE_1939_length_8846_cov_15.705385_14_plen_279_part_00
MKGYAAEGGLEARIAAGDDVAMLPQTARGQLFGDGRGVVLVYLCLVLSCFLFAAATPGRYEVQFCDKDPDSPHYNPTCCSNHLLYIFDDTSGQVAPICVFYGALLLVGVWGVGMRASPAFHAWATRTRALPRSGLGSAGELAAVAGLGLLHVWWWCWWWDYPGGGLKDEHGNPIRQSVRLAKTLGHMNDLDMSLLLLLASRTSVWESVIGLGYDAGISWHRALGTLMVVFALGHAACFQYSWCAARRIGLLCPSELPGPVLVHRVVLTDVCVLQADGL